MNVPRLKAMLTGLSAKRGYPGVDARGIDERGGAWPKSATTRRCPLIHMMLTAADSTSVFSKSPCSIRNTRAWRVAVFACWGRKGLAGLAVVCGFPPGRPVSSRSPPGAEKSPHPSFPSSCLRFIMGWIEVTAGTACEETVICACIEIASQTVRSASVGESLAARSAGKRPAMAPIRTADPIPPPHASGGITTVQFLAVA
jgi:hypothetical protein